MSVFVIACGGSGGHISPGIALAQGLVERGHHVHIVLSNKDIDARISQKYAQLQFTCVPAIPFSFKPIQLFKFLFWQLKSLWVSIAYLWKIHPDVVVGFGGFTSFGIVAAGFFLGYPRVLHEANRKPGKAIRLLSGFAKRVYLPEGVRLKGLPPQAIRHYGYPIRKEVRRLSKEVARHMLGLPATGKVLLVLGGSQGACILNQWVSENCEWLCEQGIHVYCVTGIGKGSQGVVEQCNSFQQTTRIIFVPFVDNISLVLSAADLAISRAGAGSIAEFTHCCLPSILVPYPQAADNHQHENALFFERQGGCILIPQERMQYLRDEVKSIIFNDWLLKNFRKNLELLNRFNSLERIIEDLEEMVL
jgi:UDP-N-acetylglucosamine--N-acetylmuramyl-(pentapeptide) pyrophosphoryl-undecaprenol N-acetylglucosamine transferase